MQLFFRSNSGDCDHLEPYPVFSESQNKYVNLTSWNKLWSPEIDWLNSYVNLSYYHPIYLGALANGYRITKHAKYFSHSEWGCVLMFPMDPELGNAYYMKYYANTNHTMIICTPYIPVRPDKRRKYVETFSSRYPMVRCFINQLGFLKRAYQSKHWSFIFTKDNPVDIRISLLLSAVVAITGVFG